MSEEQFWEKDPFLVIPYQEAHKLYVQQKNQEMWMNGLYTLKALEVVMSGFGNKTVKYYPEPIELNVPKANNEPTEEEVEAAKRKVIDYLDAWKQAFDAQKQETINAERSYD